MPDNEDWRRKRVEQLGLPDPTPWLGNPERPQAMAARADPLPLQPLSPAADSPLPLAERLPAQSRRRWWPGLAIVVGVLAAVALGWLLRVQVEKAVDGARLGDRQTAATPSVSVPAPARRDAAASEPAARPFDRPHETALAPVTDRLEPDAIAPEATPPISKVVEQAAPESVTAIRQPAAAKASPTVIANAPDPATRFARPAHAVALPGRDFKPSFNCRRAKAQVNRMICADPELSALDNALSASFYAAQRRLDFAGLQALHADQTAFLNERQRCATPGCVAAIYRERIGQLRDR